MPANYPTIFLWNFQEYLPCLKNKLVSVTSQAYPLEIQETSLWKNDQIVSLWFNDGVDLVVFSVVNWLIEPTIERNIVMKLIKKSVTKVMSIKNKREKLLIGILWKLLVVLMLPLFLHHLPTSLFERFKSSEPMPPVVEIPEYIEPPQFVATFENVHEIETFEDIQKHLFYIDSGAFAFVSDFPVETLKSLDLTLNLTGSSPRVLITHTHSQEFFVDSDTSKMDDSIVGVGRTLANILANDYGVSVVHDVGMYDVVNGERKIAGSYERMEAGVRQILEIHPTIDVIIDLHRDAAPEHRTLSTVIDGTPTAQLMFFNGLTRRNVDGSPEDLDDLFNPYLLENLSLSLQMFLTANEKYPGLARRNYIKAYRYSLHMKPRSLLVEVGGHTSTLEEANNAMGHLASLMMSVLSE